MINDKEVIQMRDPEETDDFQEGVVDWRETGWTGR